MIRFECIRKDSPVVMARVLAVLILILLGSQARAEVSVGYLKLKEPVPLYFSVPGKVRKVMVAPGQRVEAGDHLALLVEKPFDLAHSNGPG